MRAFKVTVLPLIITLLFSTALAYGVIQDSAVITNAEFADILVSVLGIEMPFGSDRLSDTEFFEVQSNILAEKNITQFLNEDPSAPVTRGKVADVLYNALKLSSALPDDELIVILSIEGDVKITPPGETRPAACLPGTTFGEGTRITTGEASCAEIAFGLALDQIVKVKEKTEVVVKFDGDDRIYLVDGEIFTLLQNVKKGEAFRVRTPCAVCGARGTGWGTFATQLFTDLLVFDNNVFSQGINRDGTLKEWLAWTKKGFKRRITKFANPGPLENIDPRELAQLVQEIVITAKMRGIVTQARIDLLSKLGYMLAGKPDDKMLYKTILALLNDPVLAKLVAEAYSAPGGQGSNTYQTPRKQDPAPENPASQV